MTLEFRSSEPLTLGVELELQLVNTRDYNLTRGASDLLAAVAKRKHPGDIKPEITESMIEMSTSVCSGPEHVRAELEAMRAVVADAAAKLNLGVAGGGTHPFQRWSERRIYDRRVFGTSPSSTAISPSSSPCSASTSISACARATRRCGSPTRSPATCRISSRSRPRRRSQAGPIRRSTPRG